MASSGTLNIFGMLSHVLYLFLFLIKLYTQKPFCDYPLLLFFLQSKHRRKKEAARMAEKRKTLLKKHPLEIILLVKCKGQCLWWLFFKFRDSVSPESVKFKEALSVLMLRGPLFIHDYKLSGRHWRGHVFYSVSKCMCVKCKII